VVLGRRPQHRWATNINVLDDRREVRAALHGLLEFVEIHHQNLYVFNPVFGQRRLVGRVGSVGQQATVNVRASKPP